MRAGRIAVVLQNGLAHVDNLGNGTLQIKRAGENYLKDLLHVDRRIGGRENQGCMHRLGKLSCLLRDVFLLARLHPSENIVLGADQERNRRLHHNQRPGPSSLS